MPRAMLPARCLQQMEGLLHKSEGKSENQRALKQAKLNVSDFDVVIFRQPADMLYDVWMESS